MNKEQKEAARIKKRAQERVRAREAVIEAEKLASILNYPSPHPQPDLGAR